MAAAIAIRKAGMLMRESAPHCVANRSFSAELVVASPGHEEVRVHVSFRMKKNMQPRFSTSDLFDAFGDRCQSAGLRLAFGIAEEVSEFANYQPREFGAIAFC